MVIRGPNLIKEKDPGNTTICSSARDKFLGERQRGTPPRGAPDGLSDALPHTSDSTNGSTEFKLHTYHV